MSIPDSFIIVDGVLKKNFSRDSDVIIPEGVKSIGPLAFRDCYEIESVTIPHGVTSIGAEAFCQCGNLKRVIIPDGLISIGEWAFCGCGRLESVNIPQSVTEIGRYAFCECRSFAKFSIPSAVAEIKQGTFQDCCGLTEVMISEGVTTVGNLAFSGCKCLNNITIPNSVISIGEHAFCGCSSLTGLIIPDSVTNIEVRAFHDCGALASLRLPDGLENIGVDAFYGTALYNDKGNWDKGVFYLGRYLIYAGRHLQGNYTVKAGTKGIAESAFAKNKELKGVCIPDGVSSISGYAFKDCSDLESIVIPNSVKTIGKKAFEGCQKLSDITATAWTKTISNALKDCPIHIIHTESVPSEIPNKYKSSALLGFVLAGHTDYSSNMAIAYKDYTGKSAAKLCEFAFDNPQLLRFICEQKLIHAKDIDIYTEEAEKRGNAEFKAMLLNYQNEMGSSTIAKARDKKEKVKEEYDGALTERIITRDPAKGIEGMNFVITGALAKYPAVWESRKEVQEYLESYGAKLGSSVTKKTDYLVTNNTNNVSEKDKKATELGVQIITETDFNDMVGKRFKDAQHITVPVWLKSIPSKAFQGCKKMESVTIPEGVMSIGDSEFSGLGAFSGCSSLANVTIPMSVKSIGAAAFENCSSLESVTFKKGLTSVGWQAFKGCSSLKGVELPSSLMNVSDELFMDCIGLKNLIIPEGPTSIGRQAFMGCACLETVKLPSTLINISREAFMNCSELASIYIPENVTSIGILAFDGCKKLTIHAPAGSYAEQYAEENNIPFAAE